MDIDEIKYLFNKYSNKTISKIEKRKLFSILSELDSDILESILFQNFNDNVEFSNIDVIDRDKMWDEIRRSIYANQISTRHTVFNWKKLIAVAAAVISIATISIVVFYHQKNKENLLTQTSVVEDILPGRDRAILTLSNGKKVDLDTLSVGVIISDSNTIIEKLEDGNISYTSRSTSQNIAKTNTIETPAGGTFQVSLPDGSKVWLNAMSKLKYPVSFSGETRDIELEGEAYFEIAHNKKQPFFVHLASDNKIKVLGTKFNVKAYSTAFETTSVLEGAVNVFNTFNSNVLLKNQGLIVEDGRFVFNPNQNIIEDLAWKEGYFSIEGISLRDLMDKVSKWYGVKVEFEGNIDNTYFVLKLNRNVSLKVLMKLLEMTKEVKCELKNNRLLIMKYE